MDEIIERLNETLAVGGNPEGMRFLRAVAFQFSYDIELVTSRDRFEPMHHIIDASILLSLGRQLCDVADSYLAIAECVCCMEVV